MYAGQMEGLIAFGMNPVANGPNTPKMLAALSKLKWLIVADCFETETASFWKAKELAEKYYATAPDAAADRDRSLSASCRLLRGEGRRVRQLVALGAVEERRARPAGRRASRSGDHRASVPEDPRALREGRRHSAGASAEHDVELAEPAGAVAFGSREGNQRPRCGGQAAIDLRRSHRRRLARSAATGSTPDRSPKRET